MCLKQVLFDVVNPKNTLVLLCILSFLIPSFLYHANSVNAAFNEQINYQGKLLDNTGSPVADTDYSMVFRLYTVPTGGSNIWTETQTVPVTSGLFSTMLGTTTSLSGVDFSQTLYLGVNIAGDGEMLPRKVLGAVPAAFEANNAGTVGNVASSSFLRADQADSITATESSTLLSITQNGTGDILNLFDGGTEVFTVTDGGNVGIGTSTPGGSILMTEGVTTLTNNIDVRALELSNNVFGEYLAIGSSDMGSGNQRLWFAPAPGGVVDVTREFGYNDTFSAWYFDHAVNLATNGGNVGIGTTTPSQTLTVDGSTYITGALYDNNNSAGTADYVLQSTGSGFQWVATSSLGFGGDGASDFLSLTDTPGSFTANRLLFTNSGGTALTDSADLTFDGERLTLSQITDSNAGYFINDSAAVIASTTLGSFFLAGAGSTTVSQLTSAALFNTAAGSRALRELTSGANNTAFGSDALSSLTTGDQNVSIGNFSLFANTTGTNNTAIGGGALAFAEGNFNIGIGDSAGYGQVAGDRNIIIGTEIDAASTTGSNQLNIGNLIFGTGIDGAGTTLSSGNIGIGTSSPSSKLTVWGDFTVGTSSVPAFQVDTESGQVAIGTSTKNMQAALSVYNDDIDVVLGDLKRVGTVDLGGNPKFTLTYDNYLITNRDNSTLIILDVSDPTTPVIISTSTLPGSLRENGIAKQGDYLYISHSSGVNQVTVHNIADPANPQQVKIISSGSGPGFSSPKSLAITGNYLYVGMAGSNTLEIFDISDPENPLPVTFYANDNVNYILNDLTAISIQGSYLYTMSTNSNSAFSVYDISDPLNITILSSIASDASNGFSGTDVFELSGNYAYIGTNIAPGKIVAVDISVKSDIKIVDIYDDTVNTSFAAPIDMEIVGDYLYLTSQSTEDAYSIIDISDPQNLSEINSGVAGTNPTGLSMHSDGYLYVAVSTLHDIDVYKIPDLSSPQANISNLYAGRADFESVTVTDSLSVTGNTFFSNNLYTAGQLTVRGTASSTDQTPDVAGLTVLRGGLTIGTTSTSYGLNSTLVGTEGYLGIGGGTAGEYFAIDTSGNVGIGTTSPYAKLSVAGDLALTGGIYDSSASLGTAGMVMQTTGSGFQWVATSTLGFGGGGASDFLSLSDTPGSFTANRLLFQTGSAVTDSANLTFDGIDLNLGGTNTGLAFQGVRMFYASTTNDSISIGEGAGASFESSSNDNVAIGYFALNLADNPVNRVTAIGARAFQNASGTSANNGVAIGYEAAALSGQTGVYVGYRAGYVNRGGYDSVFIGDSAGLSNTTGFSQTFVGDQAGSSNVNGIRQTMIGAGAGADNVDGSFNTFVGNSSGANNVSGNSNAFLGYQSGARLIDVTGSVALGTNALRGQTGATGGGSSVAIGEQSGINITSGIRNTMLGYYSGQQLNSGSNNILIGYNAADALTTGSNNLIIGYNVEAPSSTLSNQLNIGNLIFGTGVDGTGTTLSSGNIGIGTTSPYAKLTVDGDLALTGGIYDNTASLGTAGMVLQTTGSGVQWVATSSLGIGGGSSVTFGTDNQLPFMNSGGTDFEYSGDLTFDGTQLMIGNTTANFVANPISVSLGGTVGSNVAGATENLKLKVFDSASGDAYGLGLSSNLLEISAGQTGSAGNVAFFNGESESMRITSDGNVGIGTTTPEAKLTIENLAFSGAGVAGLDQYLETQNSVESAVQFGNRLNLDVNNTATTTLVGSIFRIEDDTVFGNTVRGLEVQVNRGSNNQGENTAISGFARTFGVRGFSSGDAGSLFEPAGGFFETGGTTQGNAIRGFSSTITGADLFSLDQETSAFTGNGIAMDFGANSGSFTGNYIDARLNGVSQFSVSNTGSLLLSGSSPYVNFGSIAGASGYGLRDSSGTLQFRNNGGAWANLGSPLSTTAGTRYDISAGVFDDDVLNVIGDDITPRDILFNNDGTVLYMLGDDGNDVTAYNLFNPYDPSTAGAGSVVLDISGEETAPYNMIFNNDGTALYVVGQNGDDINEYILSTPYDISSVSSDSVVLDISSLGAEPRALLFNNDGTVLYVLNDSTDDDIEAYDLSTPYDPSTASSTGQVLDFSVDDGTPIDIFFNGDGTVLYLVGGGGDDVTQYALGTAYDISTAGAGSVALSISDEETAPRGAAFNGDGSVLFTVGTAGIIKAWNLSNFTSNNVFVADTTANFGIGTDNPTSKLTVAGDITLMGTSESDNFAQLAPAFSLIYDNSAEGTTYDDVQSMATYDGDLYIGFGNGGGDGDVIRWDGSTSTVVFDGVADTIEALEVFDDKLFIGQGNDAGEAAIFTYDAATGATTTSEATFSSREYVKDFEVFNNELYAFVTGNSTDDSEIYRLSGTSTWTRVHNFDGDSFQISGALVAQGDTLYAIYGDNDTGQDDVEIHIYETTDGDTWTEFGVADLKDSVTSPSIGDIFAEVFNNRILIVYQGSGIAVGDGVFFLDTVTTGDDTNGSTDSDILLDVTNWTDFSDPESLYVTNNRAYIGSQSEIYYLEDGYRRTQIGADDPTFDDDRYSLNVVSNGSGFAGIGGMTVYDGALYAGYDASGADVYRITDAVTGLTGRDSQALNFVVPTSNGNATGTLWFEASTLIESVFDDPVGGFATTTNNRGYFKMSHILVSNAGAYDVAEDYPTVDTDLQPGEILMFDERNEGGLRRATREDKDLVAGIASANPGFLLSQGDRTGMVAAALVGRVPLRINNENGDIAVGDSVTISSVDGEGMLAPFGDKAVGYALEASDFSTTTVMETDTIMVYVSLHTAMGVAADLIIEPDEADVDEIRVTGNEIMRRLRDLAAAFIDGILTITGLRAEKIETTELCLGETCVDETTLRALLNDAGRGTSITQTATSTNDDSSNESDTTTGEAADTPVDTGTITDATTEGNTSGTDTATTTATSTDTKPSPDTASSTPVNTDEPAVNGGDTASTSGSATDNPEPVPTPSESESDPVVEETTEPDPPPEPEPVTEEMIVEKPALDPTSQPIPETSQP